MNRGIALPAPSSMGQVNFQFSTTTLIYAVLIFSLGLIILSFAFGSLVSLYIQCRLSDAPVGFLHILGMRVRRIDLREVLYSHIRAAKAGLDLGPTPARMLELHTRAGGHSSEVVSAMITLKSVGIPATWDFMAPADLAGRDVLAAAHNAQRAASSGSPMTLKQALDSAPLR